MKADGEGRISEFKEEVYIPRGSRGIPTWLMGRKSYRSCKLFCATKVEKTRKRHNKNGQRQKKIVQKKQKIFIMSSCFACGYALPFDFFASVPSISDWTTALALEHVHPHLSQHSAPSAIDVSLI